VIQTLKNNFNANTQGPKPGDGPIKSFIENIGQGGGNAIRSLAHPLDSAHSEVDTLRSTIAHPIDAAHSALNQAHTEVDAARADPSKFIGNAIGQIGTGAILGGGAGKALSGMADAIPSTSRAIGTLRDIENSAKDVPVSMTKTQPALADFSQSVKTGGKGK
jgi:prophage DNA circulation protein